MRPRRGIIYYLGMFGFLVGVFAIVAAISDADLRGIAHWSNWRLILGILVGSAVIVAGAWNHDRIEADEALETVRKIIRRKSNPTE